MSTMFKGYFEHNVNNQGRVSLPAKFRSILEVNYSKSLTLVGLPDRIEIFPVEEYRKKEEQDNALPKDDPRIFQYLVMQSYNAWDVDVDGMGRILIPPQLRKELGLDKEVCFVGLQDRILLFRPDKWEEFLAQAKKNYEENSMLAARIKTERRRDED